jgi:hypothetical protein
MVCDFQKPKILTGGHMETGKRTCRRLGAG